MIDPNGLLMIEPKLSVENPIWDEFTDLAQRALDESESGRRFRGFHRCKCGTISDNAEHTVRGMVTNSLIVHYVRMHRCEVPAAELEKLKQFRTAADPVDVDRVTTDELLASMRRANSLIEEPSVGCAEEVFRRFDAECLAGNPPKEYSEAWLARMFAKMKDALPEVLVELLEASAENDRITRERDDWERMHTDVAQELVDAEEEIQKHQKIDDRIKTLEAAIELPLLFHRGGVWSDENAARWLEITGIEEATTKVMCDHIRSILEPKETPSDA